MQEDDRRLRRGARTAAETTVARAGIEAAAILALRALAGITIVGAALDCRGCTAPGRAKRKADRQHAAQVARACVEAWHGVRVAVHGGPSRRLYRYTRYSALRLDSATVRKDHMMLRSSAMGAADGHAGACLLFRQVVDSVGVSTCRGGRRSMRLHLLLAGMHAVSWAQPTIRLAECTSAGLQGPFAFDSSTRIACRLRRAHCRQPLRTQSRANVAACPLPRQRSGSRPGCSDPPRRHARRGCSCWYPGPPAPGCRRAA